MATLQEKARKRIVKWRAKRFKYREIAKATGVTESILHNIATDAERSFTEETAKKILKAEEPVI